MKYILVSESNLASSNIGALLGDLKGAKIIKTKEDVCWFDRDPKVMQAIKGAELVIVASEHSSEAGVPTLTCHTTGVWTDDTTFGGSPKTLCVAPALYLREGLLEFARQKKKRKLDYQVSLEVTHHGPSIDTPIIFVEVGSTEKQWRDKLACSAAAEVIKKLISEPKKVPVAVGFGGGHYAPTFTKRVLENNIAFGHICPKHACDALDENLILQAFKKTSPHPDSAVIEWKGLNSEQKQKIIQILEKNNIKWKKDKDLKQ